MTPLPGNIIFANRHWIRAVIALIAALCILAPFAFAAEPRERPYRIGVLNEAWAANHPTVEGLKAGLRELGLEEGRHVTFEIRFTQGEPEALQAGATHLVKSGVDLIFTSDEGATRAAKSATQTIPIVFTLVGDPVASGIVQTLAKPGGNLTGISSLTSDLLGKRLEILRMLAPHLHRVWALHYAEDVASVAALKKGQKAAEKLQLVLLPQPISSKEDFEKTLKAMRSGDGLLAPDASALDLPQFLLEASLSARIPAVFSASLYVGHGGLASYGADYYAQGVQAARLVARILRGTRPGDLPVEGADRIDLAVNLKTAATLGLTVPTKVLLRADALRR